MTRTGRRKIVLLGMMTKMPVAGVVWETAQYLRGFELLGFDAYYVEAHARTPGALMMREEDDGSALAAAYIRESWQPFGLGDRWAFHALHEEEPRVLGMSERELMRLYSSAEAIVNLYAGTVARPEHYETGQARPPRHGSRASSRSSCTNDDPSAIEFLEPHAAFFTWAENYGRPGLRAARHGAIRLQADSNADRAATSGSAAARRLRPLHDDRQLESALAQHRLPWRALHVEQGRRVSQVPRAAVASGKRSSSLRLSSYEQADRDLLESRGWSVRHGLDVSTDLESYRSYVLGSRGEFTVAKDQNVRLKSGWFSDRSAAYLAAGRPVVTQDTGFGCALPTGEGLFAFETDGRHRRRRSRRSRRTTRERGARRSTSRVSTSTPSWCSVGCSRRWASRCRATRAALPSRCRRRWICRVVSSRPTTLTAGTSRLCSSGRLPYTGGDRLRRPVARGLGRQS